MVATALKRYSSPELYLLSFTSQDVLTFSTEENIEGIPQSWFGAE